MSRSSPAVWGRKGSTCHRALTCFCVSQLLMSAPEAGSKCASHKVKNSSVEERATGFTKTAKWHDCDKAALLLWHLLNASRRCCGGTLPPSGGTTCWSALAIPHRRKHRRQRQVPPWRPLALTHEAWPAPGWGTATLKVELGLVNRKLVRTSRSTAATKGSWAENARDGHLVRHGPD